jgi:hypothetical protein
LGHGALKGIHQQDAAVCHAQHALHLATKVGVAGGVQDVDLNAFVFDGHVLGRDGDAALALQVTTVHDELAHLLVVAEEVAGMQQFVYEGGFAVVYVGNDGDVADLHTKGCARYSFGQLSRKGGENMHKAHHPFRQHCVKPQQRWPFV